MVRGIDIFRDEFKDFTGSYVLIGGAACDWLMHDSGLNFRVTRDLDIIIVAEALNDAFIEKFWEFINKGRYQKQEKSAGKAIYYRFSNPEDQPNMKQVLKSMGIPSNAVSFKQALELLNKVYGLDQ
ncbi:MAG: hypothetical protein ACQER7_09545 [Bacteroidota bacterium]